MQLKKGRGNGAAWGDGQEEVSRGFTFSTAQNLGTIFGLVLMGNYFC